MSVADPAFLRHRRETFLARYPRNFKMAVTVALLALMVLPPAFMHGQKNTAQNDKINGIDMPKMPPLGLKIETDPSAPALNDQDDRTVRLVSAPDIRVSEENGDGTLPRVSEDGLHPWQVYARPFNAADKRPRVSLVITGLGMSRLITDRAITQLPPTVTLAFSSQAPVTAAWVSRARQDGHEVLLQTPMEPFDYPRSDPGPNTLLTNLPNGDNLARFSKTMRSASGYVGITSVSGSRFTTDTNKLQPIMNVLHDRGLMVLDARAAPHSIVTEMAHNSAVPVATVTQKLDTDLSPEAIQSALIDLEKTALQNGRAIGITAATPVMLTQIEEWAKTLPQKGIALAPISSMVQ